MSQFFSAYLLASGFRLAVPVVLAGLGGVWTERVRVFNIALEGMMLVAAFFGMAGGYLTGSTWGGMALGVLSALAVAWLYAALCIRLESDPIVVGIAINLGASGITAVLLESFFGQRGAFMSDRIPKFESISLPGLSQIPGLGTVLERFDLPTYLTILLVVGVYLLLFRTRFGLRVRAIGELPVAGRTAGLSVERYQYLACLLSGLFCGIAGAYLPMSGLSMFTEDMAAGKGYVALAAVIFGRAHPVWMAVAGLLFGYAQALATNLQGMGIPSQVVLTTPYVLTMIFLLFSARRRRALAA